MKKILFLLTALVVTMYSLCAPAPTAHAASAASNERIAVLLVGSNDFKTDQYFSMIEKQVAQNCPHSARISIGSDVQSMYQEYWLDKGYLEEQKPTKDDLVALVNYMNMDKVLFLMVKDPVVEKNFAMDWFDSGERSRASIQMNAFLVDKEKVLRLKASNHEDDSFASDLRAKRGAFKKCVTEITKDMASLL